MGEIYAYLSALLQQVVAFWATVVLSCFATYETISKKKIVLKAKHWWLLAAVAFLWANYSAWASQYAQVVSLSKQVSATPEPAQTPQVEFLGVDPNVDITDHSPGKSWMHPLINFSFINPGTETEEVHLYWRARVDTVYPDTSPRNEEMLGRLESLVDSDIESGDEWSTTTVQPKLALTKSLVLPRPVTAQQLSRYEARMDGIFYVIALSANAIDSNEPPTVEKICGYRVLGWLPAVVQCRHQVEK